jgi:hypothetical protein
LPGVGTNTEQLFAAGWSACFESAIVILAAKKKIALPPDPAIDAEVDLHLAGTGYFLGARFNISLPSTLPRSWWRRLSGSVRTRRLRAAISTLSSTWFENLNPSSLNKIVVALKNEIPARP